MFIDNIEEPSSDDRLLLFPTMIFEMSGNITSWTFTARRDFMEEEASQMEFQVWSPNINCNSRSMMIEYRKIGQNKISMSDLKQTGFQNVFEYKVPVSEQIEVVKGDVFGVVQPEGDAMSVVFVKDTGHLAYESHSSGSNNGLVEFEPTRDYLFPLVAFDLVESGMNKHAGENDLI